MWLTALHHLGVRIPLAWLANALGLGLAGIWLSLPVSHLAAAVSARFAARRALCKAPSPRNPSKGPANRPSPPSPPKAVGRPPARPLQIAYPLGSGVFRAFQLARF